MVHDRVSRVESRLVRSGMRRRLRAFTLTELLVALAIIGLLVSLLMPAVHFARESARRLHCSNNLRQMGIAIHLHHDRSRTLPTSVSPFLEGTSPLPQRDGSGWILRLLPELEEGALYQQFQPWLGTDMLSGNGIRSLACRDAMQRQLPLLHCPSDPSSQRLSNQQWQWTGIEVASTNYKGVIGDNQMGGPLSMFPGTLPDCVSTGACNGVFFRLTYQAPLRFADVSDGTAQTLFVGEDVPEHNYHSVAFYANGDYSSCHIPPNFFPNPPTPLDYWNVMGFRSRHPSGVMFLHGDASIHFLHENVEMPVYRAMSTRNGFEVLSEFPD